MTKERRIVVVGSGSTSVSMTMRIALLGLLAEKIADDGDDYHTRRIKEHKKERGPEPEGIATGYQERKGKGERKKNRKHRWG